MKKYIKPTLEVEKIVISSSIMSVSNINGEYNGEALKSKEIDFDEEEDIEW